MFELFDDEFLIANDAFQQVANRNDAYKSAIRSRGGDARLLHHSTGE